MSGDAHLPPGYPECGALDAYGAERDLLIDIDDDGAKRVVVDGRVVLDEITSKNLNRFVATTGEWISKKELSQRLLEQNQILYEQQRAKVQLLGGRNQPLIERPPAYVLDHWLQFLVSKKSYERIYSQIIIDTREEYFEALATRREIKAGWILVRCYLYTAWAWFLMVPTSVSVAIFKKLSGS